MTGDAEHDRLVAAIKARKAELRYQWQEIAKAAGITVEHLRKFRAGTTRLRPTTQAALEAALEWKTGAFELIRANEQPIPLHAPPTTDAKPTPDAGEEARPIEMRFAEGGSLVTFGPDPSLTEDERQAIANMAEKLAARFVQEFMEKATKELLEERRRNPGDPAD